MRRERSMWIPKGQQKPNVQNEHKPDIIYSEGTPQEERVDSAQDIFTKEVHNALDKVAYRESTGCPASEQDWNAPKISNYHTK